MMVWLFLLLCELLCPVGMIFFGYGYMTYPADRKSGGKRSGKTKKPRKDAPARCGKQWLRTGVWMLAVSAAAHGFLLGKGTGVTAIGSCVILAVQIIVMAAVVFPAKKRLRKAL